MTEQLFAHAACDEDRLPDTCHVVLPGMPSGHNVAISVRGMKGVLLTKLDFGDTSTARCAVRTFNMGRGIRTYQEHATLAGSLLGWDMPQANPRFLVRHDKRFMGPESRREDFAFPGGGLCSRELVCQALIGLGIGARLPAIGKQCRQILGTTGRQPGQDIDEVIVGVDVIEFAGLNEGIDQRYASPTALAATEEAVSRSLV